MTSDWFRVAESPDGRFVAQTKTLQGWVDISVSRASEGEAMQEIEECQDAVNNE